MFRESELGERGPDGCVVQGTLVLCFLFGVTGPQFGSSVNTVLSIASLLPHFCSLGLFTESSSPCSKISPRGVFMTGLDPHTRKELSFVVTMVQSSLEVTICRVTCEDVKLNIRVLRQSMSCNHELHACTFVVQISNKHTI